MEVANMVISDASNKLTRREIGERLCMIFMLLCFKRSSTRSTSLVMETRRCASSRLRSFPPGYVELVEEPGLLQLVLVRQILGELASIHSSAVHSSVNPARELASPFRHSTNRAC